jgi:O-acetyl-ADP-ribose deacetylase
MIPLAKSLFRRYFPPTEYDLHGEEWEEVEGGESAENGQSQEKAAEADIEGDQASVAKAKLEDMPDVPTKDPSDDGPAPKKQKRSLDDSH